MAIATAGAPDLAAIKQRQQATWASGDYHMIGTQILLASEQLIESLDVHSTDRVLDVATGSGNAALAAARRSCEVIGIDYVPSLLDRARERAIAEGVQAQFEDGDAEAIPFEDDSFDVVTSVFGSMFAPNQEAAASELARVARPGGKIGLVTHTPEGYIGNLFKVIGKHVPPPAGLRSPIQWGTEERLRELFGDAIAELRAREAAHDVPLPLAADLGRLLAAVLRSDAEGVRSGRRGRAPCPRSRPAREHRALQPGRRRHDGRAERISRGRDRRALTRRPRSAASGAASPFARCSF